VYKFKIESRNAFGFSTTFSNEATIRAASLPDAPVQFYNNIAVTASGTIGLTWSPGAYDGGSPVIDYRISYHAGSDPYVVLTTGVTASFYTASSLTANLIYTFKIEARNLIGYSAYSSEVAVRAAAKPSQPAAPLTTVVSNSGVTISWTPPNDGGSPITSY
jgi:titin